jgi:8-oxo-dGTP pyrophosphatase MutT (NUDIX family)
MLGEHIQAQILTSLLKSQGLRYSEAKPEQIESDLFNYHLKYLVQNGLVEKTGVLYSLSASGKRYVAELKPMSPTGREVDMFKLAVLTLVLARRDNGIFVLNQTRMRQPFYGQISVMGGTIHKGEYFLDAANRKLKVETGLEAEDFKLTGLIRKITYLSENTLFTDVLFHLCICTRFRGELIENTLFGRNSWYTIDEAIRNEESASAPTEALTKLLKKLRDGSEEVPDYFYAEERHIVDHI